MAIINTDLNANTLKSRYQLYDEKNFFKKRESEETFKTASGVICRQSIELNIFTGSL